MKLIRIIWRNVNTEEKTEREKKHKEKLECKKSLHTYPRPKKKNTLPFLDQAKLPIESRNEAVGSVPAIYTD